jgi:hypothetical protein
MVVLMPYRVRRFGAAVLGAALLLAGVSAAHADAPLEFHLRFDPAASKEPFTGRVYVILSKKPVATLPSGPNWFHPEPFFAVDVKNWKPGEVQKVTAHCLGFPARLDQLPSGKYWAFAVMDWNRGGRSFITSEGNIHSKPAQLELSARRSGAIPLLLDQIYQVPALTETDRVKFVKVQSKYLSDFHKRPVYLQAGVVLPQSFAKNQKQRYPVLYEIPGFGGNHRGAHHAALRNASEVAGVDMLYVVLDSDCPWGHHVFADSENNGPCGKALCQELIPHIEKTFRGLGVPTARFVTGHSSGGWSSLWLQATYPEFFGGTWSTAPDPVDFRDFQRVNVYAANANVFTDDKGALRPLAHQGKKILLHFKPFSDMEEVMGHGGQLRSFEAVFSPKGADGQPLKLWDRQTGKVNTAVAKAWERYDIRLMLEKNWPKLGPKLAGKIHIYMGGEDTFYLEGATILLKQALAQLGSNAVVEIFPGKDHGSLMTTSLRTRIAAEMAKQYRKQHPVAG